MVISLKNPVFCPPNFQNLKHHFWKKKMDANRMDYEEKSIKKNKNNNEKLVIFVWARQLTNTVLKTLNYTIRNLQMLKTFCFVFKET